ncbi:MAG: uracil phosphoribosyltransferase [Ignavibacteria bacterium]|jgi:uracil phosphoribosyltransferase
MNNITVVDHPLLKHSLTILRDKNTGTEEFHRHSAMVSQIIILEAIKSIEPAEIEIETPLEKTNGYKLHESIVFVPVLRAGLALLEAAKNFLPFSSVGFIGLERDERTAKAREYYKKFPPDITEKIVIVLDPMLATGGSMLDTVKAVKQAGANNVRAVCVVAAPEGISRLQDNCPDVKIYTASVDSHLNDVNYIVPGLGDFGDRYFGT